MKLLATILAVTLLTSPPTVTKDRLTTGFPELPRDARNVAERSLACQHFAGEYDGTGDERYKEVRRKLKKLHCATLEGDAERMRAKYRNRPEVLELLDQVLEWLAA